MAKINKKTNEAWFGDTFNRGTLNAYIPETGTVCFTANNCSINSDVLNELAGCVATTDCAISSDSTAYTVAKGYSGHAGVTIGAVDSLSDQLDAIKARIGALEESIATKQRSSMRNGLKTLGYKREVE